MLDFLLREESSFARDAVTQQRHNFSPVIKVEFVLIDGVVGVLPIEQDNS